MDVGLDANIDRLVRVGYVMDALGVSKATAYRIIASLNEELADRGVRTIPGRVSRAYLEHRYLVSEGIDANVSH